MILHTLGPEATDSNAAAKWYAKQHSEIKIQLHDNFLAVLNHLADYQGDEILIPMAYQDANGNSLGDYHYRLLGKMQLVDVFLTDLNPIVVLEKQSTSHKLYTHPATMAIAKQYQNDNQIELADSKYVAYQNYQKDGKLVITNQKNLHTLSPNEKILQTIHSKMGWCVYRIGGINS